MEATSLDLVTMTNLIADPYRVVRWDNDDEVGEAGVLPRDDDGRDGGDGVSLSRPTGEAGPSGIAGGGVGLFGAADGEASPSGTAEESRGLVT